MSYYRVKKREVLALENGMTLSRFVSKGPLMNPLEEFDFLDEITYLKTHKSRFFVNKDVLHLNRYTDILPCKLNK